MPIGPEDDANLISVQLAANIVDPYLSAHNSFKEVIGKFFEKHNNESSGIKKQKLIILMCKYMESYLHVLMKLLRRSVGPVKTRFYNAIISFANVNVLKFAHCVCGANGIRFFIRRLVRKFDAGVDINAIGALNTRVDMLNTSTPENAPYNRANVESDFNNYDVPDGRRRGLAALAAANVVVALPPGTGYNWHRIDDGVFTGDYGLLWTACFVLKNSPFQLQHNNGVGNVDSKPFFKSMIQEHINLYNGIPPLTDNMVPGVIPPYHTMIDTVAFDKQFTNLMYNPYECL